jgi:hypothetical protein
MFHDVGKSQQHDYWRMYLVALYNSELNAMGSLESIEYLQRGLGGCGCAACAVGPTQFPRLSLLN